MARRSRPARPAAEDDENMGPSTEWGWHGSFPRGFRLAGLGSVVVLVGFLLTTRDFDLGATAVAWLVGIALVILLGLVLSVRRRRPY